MAHQRRGIEHLPRPRAETLRRNGFEPLGPGSQSMMGKRGEYTASIRCVPEQQIVFFVMSGPSPAEANRLLDSVFRGF